MLLTLWHDDSGNVAIEYLFLATIVGIGLVVGFSNLASALNVEYTELGRAIVTLDQSYNYVAASGCAGSHGGANVTETAGVLTYGETATVAPVVSTNALNINSCP
jgi:Flp pilus assembly pilin Flp